MALYKDKSIRRVNYYDDLLLTEDELNVEQYYHEKMRQMQNSSFYGYGIVKGLEFESTGNPLVYIIKKGTALLKNKVLYDETTASEIFGKEIIVLEDITVDLSSTVLSQGAVETGQNIQVTIKNIETLDDKQLLKGDDYFKKVITCECKINEITSSTYVVAKNEILIAELLVTLNSEKLITGVVSVNTGNRIYGGLETRKLNTKKLSLDTLQSNVDQKIKPLPSILNDNNELIISAKNVNFNLLEPGGTGNDFYEKTKSVINGVVNVNGDLTVKGNVTVTDDVGPGTTLIDSSQLNIKDNIITLNNNDDGTITEGKKAGIEINYEMGNGGKPFIAFVAETAEEPQHWVVNDGITSGELAINLPSELFASHISNELHKHTYLSLTNQDDKALYLDDDGNVIISDNMNLPGEATVEKLTVDGKLGIENGILHLPGGKVQDSLNSLFYTHIFIPTDNTNISNSTELQKLIANDRIIYIAKSDNSLPLVMNESISIINKSNIKIILADSVNIKHSDELSSLFKISGNCSNIEFENISIQGNLNLCEILDTPNTIVTELSIKKCSNNKTSSTDGGYLLNHVSTQADATILRNINIECNNWKTKDLKLIHLNGNLNLDNLNIKNNFFEIDSAANDELESSINLSAAGIIDNIKIKYNNIFSNSNVLKITASETSRNIDLVQNSIRYSRDIQSYNSRPYVLKLNGCEYMNILKNNIVIQDTVKITGISITNSSIFKFNNNIIKYREDIVDKEDYVLIGNNCNNFIATHNIIPGDNNITLLYTNIKY